MMVDVDVTVGTKIQARVVMPGGPHGGDWTEYGIIAAGPLTRHDVEFGCTGYYVTWDEWTGEIRNGHLWRIEVSGSSSVQIKPIDSFPVPVLKR